MRKGERLEKSGWVNIFGSPFKTDLFSAAEVMDSEGISWKGTDSGGGGSLWVKQEDESRAVEALREYRVLE